MFQGDDMMMTTPGNCMFQGDALVLTTFRGQTRPCPCFAERSAKSCLYLCKYNKQKEVSLPFEDLDPLR
ncbi:hypothetical protein A2U01_0006125, partial [Trifolium medium]|nr:hypothetical protein [Trifolium medium]